MADFDLNNFLGMDVNAELDKLVEKAKKIRNGERAYSDEEVAQMNKDRKVKEQANRFAAFLKTYHDAFMDAGFSDEQAFVLTVDCLRTARK